MKVFNNTDFSIDEINSFELIGNTRSMWRGRNIALKCHTFDSPLIVSDGITFNGSMRVICVDKEEDWATALDYIEHGKMYISE